MTIASVNLLTALNSTAIIYLDYNTGTWKCLHFCSFSSNFPSGKKVVVKSIRAHRAYQDKQSDVAHGASPLLKAVGFIVS